MTTHVLACDDGPCVLVLHLQRIVAQVTVHLVHIIQEINRHTKESGGQVTVHLGHRTQERGTIREAEKGSEEYCSDRSTPTHVVGHKRRARVRIILIQIAVHSLAVFTW
jgi:hypothetical protein